MRKREGKEDFVKNNNGIHPVEENTNIYGYKSIERGTEREREIEECHANLTSISIDIAYQIKCDTFALERYTTYSSRENDVSRSLDFLVSHSFFHSIFIHSFMLDYNVLWSKR